jgi:hypothetical protein
MIFENEKTDYLGKTKPDKTELFEVIFYISLLILILFYLSIFASYTKKKKL